QKNKIWYRSKTGAIWNIDLYDPENKVMHGVRIFMGNDKSFIRKRIDAMKATWNGQNWEFQGGYIRTFQTEGLDKTEYFEKKSFPLSAVPKDFEKVRMKSEEMSIREMYHSVKLQASEGKDMTKPMVELHQKISYPFTSIVLTLLAIPLSLRSSRRGGVMFCVAVNLGMGFVFSFLYAVGISLGYGGTFGPVLAAWGPNLLFTSLGFYLILTLDSERILPI
ncbi:MAG: LptF/LptG family permease, partial [Nitrospinaceae bacterium]